MIPIVGDDQLIHGLEILLCKDLLSDVVTISSFAFATTCKTTKMITYKCHSSNFCNFLYI
jgi:hypothetical protein